MISKPHRHVKHRVSVIWRFITRGSIALWRLLCDQSIAFASLVVAVAALWFSYEAQKSDKDYKELMIKPYIEVGPNTDKFTIEVGNAGLGPAVLQRITFGYRNNCIDTDDKQQSFDAYLASLPTAISDYMAKAMPANVKLVSDQTTLIPTAGMIVPVGKHWAIFKYTADSLKKYTDVLPSTFSDSFAKRSNKLPLRIYYCSMSSDFCETVPTYQSIECPEKN